MAASDAAELGRSAGDWAACEALAAFRSALPQGEAGLALLAASLPELDGPQSLAGGARRFADLRLVISALAVALAPRARVNAILVPAEDRGGACAKALAYLLTAPSITGQVLVMRPLGAGAP
jgi:hypothetical protein